MSVGALLERLAERGIQLSLQCGDLRYEGPQGALSKSLLEEMRRNRGDLIAHLSADASSVASPPTASKRFSLFGRRLQHSPLIDPEWTADHPFFRYVEPAKGYLLETLKLNKTFVKAQGVWLYEQDEVATLDCLAQYGALPFGHHPQAIWQALADVRESTEPAFAAHCGQNAAGELAETLLGLWPEAGFSQVTFTNSGAESVEVAIKLCRAATGRDAILSTSYGFHGLTLGALSIAGNHNYRLGFTGTGGNVQVPYGDVAALEAIFEERGHTLAAFVVEAIQGEAGIVDPPPDYLAVARRLCDQYDALLVVDEVQTGLGRTGDLFACQYHGVVPDVMPLAKALGGGLLPIGACLYGAAARSEAFGLRHSSTFAGGSLACRAALATLHLLMDDDRAIIRDVAENGRYLRELLKSLQSRYPTVVAGVTGRGYMQGLQLRFEELWRQPGLIGFLHDQNILIHLVVSHLLNEGHVRVAPSFSIGDVIRIEPPLIATRSHLDLLAEALDATLSVLVGEDTLALLKPMLGEHIVLSAPPPAAAAPAIARPAPHPTPRPAEVGCFAFIVHPMSEVDLMRIEPALGRLPPEDARRLLQRFADYVDPRPVESVEIQSRTGARAYGEMILVAYTPKQMIEMGAAKAAEEIELAVRVAKDRGARVVGLGGFTSIVTQGGMALSSQDLPPLTSGNAFTAAAARQSLLQACQARGVDPARATVAVIGAAGMIGRAVSLLLSHSFARVLLIGNTTVQEGYRRRMLRTGQEVVRDIVDAAEHCSAAPGSLAEAVQGLPAAETEQLFSAVESAGRLSLEASLESCLPAADCVVCATSSLDLFVKPGHLKRDAIVCDVSRPFNVDPAVASERPDVLLIEGGLVALPPGSPCSVLAGPAAGIAFACAAETMLWALDQGYDRVSPASCMEIDALLHLERLADEHGFRVLDPTAKQLTT